ncbi:SH3 domain-containing protein [Microvirga sp. G4-2]|uniref:SH3 domain-containing protein n=1 Tax=Microvirga sp. G4-2 TaxID=3434467 RepID=UPI0040446694
MVIKRLRIMLLPLMLGAAYAHHAQAAPNRGVSPPLPRFASLKNPQINVRAGPGLEYPIRWIYKKRSLPVEIIAEYGNWRRIRGSDGSDGWINAVLLSPNRTALIRPWGKQNVDLRSRPSGRATLVAKLQPRVIVRIQWCDRTWCSVSVSGRDYHGYVHQADLWGVYPDEVLEERSMWNSLRKLL